MSEPAIIALLSLGPLLWLLGGYRWKWLRRFVWPLCVGLALTTYCPVSLAFLVGLTTCLTCVLPYGERTPWPVKLFVFASYGLPGLWLDTPFCLLYSVGMAIVVGSLVWLSQRFNRLTWKVVEASIGLLQATGIILSTLR